MQKFFLLSFYLIGCMSFAVPLSAQWEVGAYLGKGVTAASDLHVTQPSRGSNVMLHKVEYEDRSFESPLYYGVRIGYFIPSMHFFGVEIDFIHLKVYTNADQQVHATGDWRNTPLDRTIHFGDVVQGFNISHGVNLLLVNAVVQYGILKDDDVLKERIRLLGKIGIGPAIPHTESTIDNESQEQYEINGPALQIAVGAEVRIVEDIHWLVEYKFSSMAISDVSIVGGTASTTLRTHHFVSGIAVRL